MICKKRHTAVPPFETIASLQCQPVPLDLMSLRRKLPSAGCCLTGAEGIVAEGMVMNSIAGFFALLRDLGARYVPSPGEC